MRNISLQSNEIAVETCAQYLLPNERPSIFTILPSDITFAQNIGKLLVKTHCKTPVHTSVRLDHALTFNCHGLTFASRRTVLYDPACLRRILNDDGYKIITDEQKVEAGDVIIYLGEAGDIEHSGIVIIPPRESNFFVSIVLSKWGIPGPEIIHKYNESPYNSANVEYYRLSP